MQAGQALSLPLLRRLRGLNVALLGCIPHCLFNECGNVSCSNDINTTLAVKARLVAPRVLLDKATPLLIIQNLKDRLPAFTVIFSRTGPDPALDVVREISHRNIGNHRKTIRIPWNR